MRGLDDKRHYTGCIVIDGLGNLISPTQIIWAGADGQQGACPEPNVPHAQRKHSLWLRHTQTKSHWTTVESLKELIEMTAEHAKSAMEAGGMEPRSQKWVFIMDCYSVHISAAFLAWARATHPNMILLFIPATHTAYLQPLDISFNYVFKAILRGIAAKWLGNYVADELRKNGRDPTKVKLDIRLTTIKPRFCEWVAAALEEMAGKKELIMRGWKESRMGEAFGLVDMLEESAEYQKAQELDENGELFASFTSKKRAGLAEYMLQIAMEAHEAPLEDDTHTSGSAHDLLGADLEGELAARSFYSRVVATEAESGDESGDDEQEPATVTAVLGALAQEGARVTRGQSAVTVAPVFG